MSCILLPDLFNSSFACSYLPFMIFLIPFSLSLIFLFIGHIRLTPYFLLRKPNELKFPCTVRYEDFTFEMLGTCNICPVCWLLCDILPMSVKSQTWCVSLSFCLFLLNSKFLLRIQFFPPTAVSLVKYLPATFFFFLLNYC